MVFDISPSCTVTNKESRFGHVTHPKVRGALLRPFGLRTPTSYMIPPRPLITSIWVLSQPTILFSLDSGHEQMH